MAEAASLTLAVAQRFDSGFSIDARLDVEMTPGSVLVLFGPSGAGVWSSPTIDPKRRVLYAATGNMYTEPQQGTSDAIMALDLDSGAVRWTAQVTPKDVFVVGCNQPNPANCPAEVGPDFDFGSSPILAKLPNGKEVIVDGQKSGVGWAFDPDARGAVLWQYRAAKGRALGGMEFGSAVDASQAYFAVADGNSPQPGGLHAVQLATGERAWYAPPPAPKCTPGRGCNAAILAAKIDKHPRRRDEQAPTFRANEHGRGIAGAVRVALPAWLHPVEQPAAVELNRLLAP